jgi:hypothetical protein
MGARSISLALTALHPAECALIKAIGQDPNQLAIGQPITDQSQDHAFIPASGSSNRWSDESPLWRVLAAPQSARGGGSRPLL